MDGSATVIPGAGVDPYTYEWDTGDSTMTVNGLAAGSYMVTVSDRFGCSDVIEVTVDVVSAIEEVENITNIELYPNPTTGLATLKIDFIEAVDAQIQLVNLMGQVLFHRVDTNVESAQYELDLNNYPSGLYMVRVVMDNQIHTEKLIKSN